MEAQNACLTHVSAWFLNLRNLRNLRIVLRILPRVQSGLDISMKWQGTFVSTSAGNCEVPTSTYPLLR